MNWEQWLEKNQCHIEWGDDSANLMKAAYVAGIETAYNLLYANEDGDYYLVMWQIKSIIEESKNG